MADEYERELQRDVRVFWGREICGGFLGDFWGRKIPLLLWLPVIVVVIVIAIVIVVKNVTVSKKKSQTKKNHRPFTLNEADNPVHFIAYKHEFLRKTELDAYLHKRVGKMMISRCENEQHSVLILVRKVISWGESYLPPTELLETAAKWTECIHAAGAAQNITYAPLVILMKWQKAMKHLSRESTKCFMDLSDKQNGTTIDMWDDLASLLAKKHAGFISITVGGDEGLTDAKKEEHAKKSEEANRKHLENGIYLGFFFY